MHDWAAEYEYLEKTRKYLWNDDYLEFLVSKVWRIEKPVGVADFGCGYGFLGMKLLSILPKGSTYTGIDCSEELLERARNVFAKKGLEAEFIAADLLAYELKENYDFVICQSVLRHIPEYPKVLQKMADSACAGGLVVCMEVNRRIENAGIYVEGKMDEITAKDSFYKSRWKEELDKGGRDYLAGAKIPMLMEREGLKNVSVRVNDFAEYISPTQDDYKEHMEFFCKEHGMEYKEQDVCALGIRSMIISYGWK